MLFLHRRLSGDTASGQVAGYISVADNPCMLLPPIDVCQGLAGEKLLVIPAAFGGLIHGGIVKLVRYPVWMDKQHP